MKTPTEFNITRMPKDGCAEIWEKHHDIIEDMRMQRNIAKVEAVCVLRHTGPETIDAMTAVADAVNELETAPRILLAPTAHDGPYTIAGALYADIVVNPNLDDEAADALYKTIIKAAIRPLLRPPGTTISWNPADTVTADLMKPYAKNPIGPHTPSVH